MCSLQDDNHNTPEPPPSKEAGLRHQPIGARDPGCPTYGVAVAVQGEDMGWSGRGRVRGRSARVQRGWEPAGVQLPRRPPGVRVQLPSAVLDWARQAIVHRGRPVHVSSSRREGQTQITTIVPRADRAGRKVSGPRQSGDSQRQGDAMQDRRVTQWEEGGQPEGCAGRTGSRVRSPGGEPRGMRCPRCKGGGWCVAGAEPERTLARQRQKERRTAVRGAGHPQLVKGPRSAWPLMLHKSLQRHRIVLSPRERDRGDKLEPLLPVWISRLDVQGLVVAPHGCHGDLGGARPEPRWCKGTRVHAVDSGL
ncbi:hypothetical protein NN561_011472 [Cricetulus griseus]